MTKRTINLLTYLLIGTTFLLTIACEDKKDYGYNPDIQNENPLKEITAPEDFDWNLMKSLDITTRVSDAEYGDAYHTTIEIFDQNPVINTNAKLIMRGFAKNNQPLYTTITVPKTFEHIFIKQTTPTGLASVRMESTENSSILCDFSSNGTRSRANVTDINGDAIVTIDVPEVDPNDKTLFPVSAPSDAIVIDSSTKTSNDKNYIVNSQTTAIGDGQNISLYVTEDATLNSMKNILGRKIYILPGKKLTLNFALNFSTVDCLISVGEGAQLVTANSMELAQNSKIYSLGTISCGGQIYTKGTSIIYSTGSVIVDRIKLDTGSTYYNLGKAEIATAWDVTGGSGSFYNGPLGEITIPSSFKASTGNIFINDGKVNLSEFSSVGSSRLQNNGTVTVSGLTNVDAKECVWHNEGTWITGTMTTIGIGNNFLNGCKLIVNDKLTMSSTVFTNLAGSYIKTKDFHMENSHISMGSEAFIDVTGLAMFVGNRDQDPRGDKKEGMYGIGTEGRALLKMAEAQTISGNASQAMYYHGNLQVACDNHFPYVNPINQYNPKQWKMEGGAEWASEANATVYIPSTDCSDGAGTNPNPPVEPDPEDIVDPFNYSFVYEDQWPFYGDYDMNDIVIYVNKITKTPNKDNKITKMTFDFTLKAVGGNKNTAAALMLDGMQTSLIQDISYSDKAPTSFNLSNNKVESGQDYAVIPLFDNSHSHIGAPANSLVNTTKGHETLTVPAVTVTVTFATPIELKALDITKFNLFIITDIEQANVKSNARKEIHIIDYAPSKKANTSLFGANDDRSSASKYYISRDNLTWGIVIPDEFKWPVERCNILDAYSDFATWVTSGGTENEDWYLNPSNSNNIYSK